uniref:Uncharacterized protein n=1 Tax=Lepeophtheirus salmonis TaxID=72036 RepID=A0A0K2TGT4_LEPSM
MTTLWDSLNSDRGKSRPPECQAINNVLILKSCSKLMTFRLPHQTPIGSLDLTDQVLCMTGIESDGFLIILLGDAEGSITFLTEFCVPYKKQKLVESQPILRLKSSPLRKDEICAISSFCIFLFSAQCPDHATIKDEIPYTKLVPPMHELKDAVILLPRPKSLFDQLHEHQKTEGPLVITVGTGVLFQKHTFPSTLSEWDLAKNVVSTVKSGFFRVFGSSDKDTKKIETEKRLVIVMKIKDAKKTALFIESSPDGRFTAVSDLQHRIQLFDNELGRLLQVWKGYHHARFAWIFSEETAKSPPVLLLSIYSPRRKKIEIWSPVNKARISEFNVDDPGTFVKFKDGNKFINLVTGEIFSFIVPMASVHDPLQGIDKFKRTLNKFYRLNNEEDTDRYLKELLYLIRSAGSQHQQCSLLLELLQSANITTQQGLSACNSLRKDSHGDITSAFIERLVSIIKLKIHLESCSITQDIHGTLDEFIVDNFPDNELCDFSTNIDLSSNISISEITFGKFMSFVEINRFCQPEFQSLNGPNLLLLTYHIASGFLDIYIEKTIERLLEATPDLDLCRIFFFSATQGSLKLEHIGKFTPFLKNYWEYACRKSELYRLSAKNFFYHSQMTHSNLGIMKLWIAFICERENELNEDFIRVSSLIRTFLLMREQFSNLTQIYDMKGNTFDEVFNKGNGMLPSIVVSWFISAELKLDIAEEFRLKTIHLFPQSFSQETFYSHYSWSLFAYQNNAYIKNFSSMNDIKTILTDKIMTPILKHRLSAILWSNFVQGYIRVLLKLFKGSGFREIAPNEIGIKEDYLSDFFDFLHFVKTFDLYHWEELEDSQNIELIKYDDVSFVEQPFIGDFINTFTRSEEYEYMAGIYFQAIIIIQFMWQFKIDCNPLSLFERRDLDEIIFPNDDKQSSRSFSIGFQILRGFSGEMEKYRTAFLEKTSFRLVDLIEIGDGDQMKKDEFELWVTKYYTLAGYWNMRSKSKIYIMKELYKAGYDSAGREMFEPSSFEQEELNELKSIACLRLAKILSQASPSTTAIVSSTKPELRNKLAYCEVFTDDFVDVPIRKTRDLFSLICSVDDDEEMLDCLSIVRSIQEANLE